VHTVLYKGTLAIRLLNYVGWMPEMNVGETWKAMQEVWQRLKM
jgi:hypothetical protein